MKTQNTKTGSVNKNNQRNNGNTGIQGSDYLQEIYAMECLDCEHRYGANGSAIWERKCPECQHGDQCSTPDCVNGSCIACKGG